MTAAVTRSAKLGCESLETREVPAILSVTNTPNAIIVQADDNGSQATISRPTATSKLTIVDNQTGRRWRFSVGTLGKNVIFNGGDGADRISAAGAITPLTLYGKGGNDVLSGGALKDYIDGGEGDDLLSGRDRNDTIYGRDGNDQLFGNRGSDFLDDGGSPGDVTDGGKGDDFLARSPVLLGTLATDVNQTYTPTCWVLAPLSAAAQSGIDLASRIIYQGDGVYRVMLLKENGDFSYQYVNLEGGRLSFEPDPNGDESWVILFHRAIMQELDIDWKNPDAYRGGYCSEVMSMLSGRPTEDHAAWESAFDTSFLIGIQQSLLDNQIVTATTVISDYGENGSSVSTPKLVGSHCYQVLNIDFSNSKIVLRNPWGSDGWKCYDGSDNGIVTIGFTAFAASFTSVAIS